MGSPALIAGQATGLLQRVNAALRDIQNRVETGGLVADGGTTQASGANTAPNFDVDVTELLAMVKGKPHHLAAGTDVDADAGADVVWGATSGKACWFSVVMETGAGNTTPAFLAPHAAVADTADAARMTEAAIEAAVGHSNWILLADVLLTRTGDTTITVTVSYSRRGGIRGRIADGSSFDVDLATTEAEWRNYGA